MDDIARTYGLADEKANQNSMAGSVQDRRHPHLSRLSRYSTSGSSSSTCRDLNYCEVYFLSPTKQRSKDNLHAAPSSPTQQNSWSQKAREQYQSQSSENSFVLNSAMSYPSNRVYETNCDGFETRSHFSDSVATVPNQMIQMSHVRGAGVTFSNHVNDEERVHSNRGSLKRIKGRSNQSLCSCDADTEIVPNPNRPLYQYSLDRKNKMHTYTCEQNAQILMRIERERRKTQNKGSAEIKSDSTTEVEVIPPPPPPPASLGRKIIAAAGSATFQQHQQQQDISSKGHSKPIALTTTSMAESMLNDCTSTILNCANVGHLGSSKPDLCNVNQDENVSSKSRSNQENIPMAPYSYVRDDTYMPCFKSKADNSMFLYHHESPQYAPNFDNRPYSGKFNTIGPSSYFSKHFNRQPLGKACNTTNGTFPSGNSLSNGRYFSQSFSNFSFSGHLNNPTNDGYQWHQHSQDLCATPYTQFKTPVKGLSCSFGESTLMNSSYTTLGSSTSGGIKEKLHHQQQQQPRQQAGLTGSMPWKHRQCPSRGSSSSGTNSSRLDPSKHWLAVSSILLIVGAASVAVPLALRVAASAPFEERLRAATQLLDEVPLIDGHNDLPWNIRKFLHNKLNDFNFDEDLRNVMPWARSHWSHTDLKRLKQGRVAAQFWAAYVPCEAQHRDAVQLTLEQIDVIKRLTERYSKELTTCTSVSDIIEAHKNHKVCSLTGVEGGHSLGGSLAVLRTLYAIGVRYLTLTSTCHTPWADSSHADAPKYDIKHGGLTVFGKKREIKKAPLTDPLQLISFH
ncbi:unnamed protein product [Hermetia illucens]|uniref:Dipeptidase n=1 Tax=Hermetia illucens TaxID=343691 RepID=A0A7R8UFU3_HERIL|nr:unnamed protein product [Hermetia illucens]